MKRRAAGIRQRHPAVQVRRLILAAHRQNVIRIPRKIPRQVRRLNLLLPRAGIFQRHQQRRPFIKIRRHFRKAVALVITASNDVVPDFPHRPVVIRQQSSFHLFPLSLAILAKRAHQRHFLAHVLVQQFRRIQQIVFVVLLNHAQLVRLRQRPEMHRGGIHRSRNIRELQAERSTRQVQLPHIPHQRNVGVINRDIQVRLIIQRRRLRAFRFFRLRLLLRPAVFARISSTRMSRSVNHATHAASRQVPPPPSQEIASELYGHVLSSHHLVQSDYSSSAPIRRVLPFVPIACSLRTPPPNFLAAQFSSLYPLNLSPKPFIPTGAGDFHLILTLTSTNRADLSFRPERADVFSSASLLRSCRLVKWRNLSSIPHEASPT